MREKVRIWEDLQRAETMLVRNGARRHPDLAGRSARRYDIPAALRHLLVRVGSGMDPDGFTAEQYRQRYPFSTVTEIGEAFEALAAGGLCERDGTTYRLTGRAVAAVRASIDDVGEMIRLAQPDTIPPDDVHRLLWFDRRILAALRSADRPHASVVFALRCRGLGPGDPDGELWRHWQHVWTMIAFHEDEEEYVRRQGALDPLAWFVRRNLWMIDRRPWLARAATVPELAARLAQYSPVTSAVDRVRAAVRELSGHGWVTGEHSGDGAGDGGCRLSPAGLAATDRDEARVDEGFLAAWPRFDDATWEELDQLAGRVAARLDAVGSG